VERSFVWREIDAAFENRILTDAIINTDSNGYRATTIFRIAIARARHNEKTQLYKSEHDI